MRPLEIAVGSAAVAVLIGLIWLGSEGLVDFDPTLLGYTVAIIALTFAVAAYYARWLRMPATGRYWWRSWQLVTSWSQLRRLPGLLPRALGSQLVGQGFIRRRGLLRWIGHQCLFWGVLLTAAITFPLVFGWLAFRLEPGTETVYRAYFVGMPTFAFETTSFVGWSFFHLLDYTAVLVIAGCLIFLWRRFRDRAVMAGQRLGYDMLPLLMLLVIAVTGLMLTASTLFFEGAYYGSLVIIHMTVVVLSLVFVPFGKFFHILQRPASVGIQMLTEAGAQDAWRGCNRCGEPLASELFVTDLRATLEDLGQDYTLPGRPEGAGHLVELCPRCKRVSRGEAYFLVNGPRF